jgi:antitoxin HicB
MVFQEIVDSVRALSVAAVDRLLDPENTSVTFNTLGKAASILGKRIKIELVES